VDNDGHSQYRYFEYGRASSRRQRSERRIGHDVDVWHNKPRRRITRVGEDDPFSTGNTIDYSHLAKAILILVRMLPFRHEIGLVRFELEAIGYLPS